MEALISRFKRTPQTQVHSRSLSVNSLLIAPQQEHIFELGSKRPILNMFFPLHSALYSNIETIVISKNGILDVNTFRYENDALVFFVKTAENLGVLLEEDDINKATLNNMTLVRIIRQVDEHLEKSGNELRWFNTPLK